MSKLIIALTFVFLLIIIGISFTFWMIASEADPQISLKETELEAMFYVNGRPERTGILPVNSLGAKVIDSVLSTKKGKFKKSFISYSPIILIRSNDFSINIHKNIIIINIFGDYKRQLVCNINEKEFNFIRKAILASLKAEKGT